MLDIAHIDPDKLDQLGVDELRELVGQLLERSGRDAHEIGWRDTKHLLSFVVRWTPGQELAGSRVST